MRLSDLTKVSQQVCGRAGRLPWFSQLTAPFEPLEHAASHTPENISIFVHVPMSLAAFVTMKI